MDSFVAHFPNILQNPNPRQWCIIMYFGKLYTVKLKGLVKTWGKFSPILCIKERVVIFKCLWRRYIQVINACPDVYGACLHISRFRRFNRHWLSSTGEKIFWFLCDVYLTYSLIFKLESSASAEISKLEKCKFQKRKNNTATRRWLPSAK